MEIVKNSDIFIEFRPIRADGPLYALMDKAIAITKSAAT